MVPGEECTRVTGPVLAPHQTLRDSRGITGDIRLAYSVGAAPARPLPGTRYCVPLSILGQEQLIGPAHTPGEGKSLHTCDT